MDEVLEPKSNYNKKTLYVIGDISKVIKCKAEEIEPVRMDVPYKTRGLGLIDGGIGMAIDGYCMAQTNLMKRLTTKDWMKFNEKDFLQQYGKVEEGREVKWGGFVFCKPNYEDRFSILGHDDSEITGKQMINFLKEYLEEGHYMISAHMDLKRLQCGWIKGPPERTKPIIEKGDIREDGFFQQVDIIIDRVQKGISYNPNKPNKVVICNCGLINLDYSCNFLYLVGDKGYLKEHGGDREKELFEGENKLDGLHLIDSKKAYSLHSHGLIYGSFFNRQKLFLHIAIFT